MDEVADGTVPIVCPSCRDLVSVNGELDGVETGDPIRAFCASCEHTIEVAAPEGIGAFQRSADQVSPTVTEFASGAPRA